MESNSPIKCYFTLGGINYKNGFVTSCPQQPEQFVRMEQTILPSEIFNSEKFKNHRLEMMNGKWSHGCHLCRDPEAIGSHSMRQDYVADADFYDTESGAVNFKGLRHVELRFSNACNMACKHCSVVYSSGWMSKLKHYVPDDEAKVFNLTQLLRTEHRENDTDVGQLDISIEQMTAIIEDLNTNFPQLEKVEFAGGEVLYQKQFFPCLRLLASHPNVANMSIGFHTNFNAKFDPVELSNLLMPFRRSIIHMSLDAGTNIYPYFRTGNWETLKENIRRFREVNTKTLLGIVCTTSAYQVMDIYNIFESFLTLDVDTINAAMCYSPQYINPSVMNIHFAEQVKNDIEKTRAMILEEQKKRMDNFAVTSKMRAWKSYYNRFNDIHDALRSLKEIEIYTLNNKISSEYWDAFQVYVKKTDEIWQHNFNDYMVNYKFLNGKIERIDNV